MKELIEDLDRSLNYHADIFNSTHASKLIRILHELDRRIDAIENEINREATRHEWRYETAAEAE